MPTGYTFTAPNPKDPDAELDYPMDWTPWLTAINDTLASSEWLVEEGTVVINTLRCTFTPEGETVGWVGGGVEGEVAIVTNRVVTAGGREDDRSVRIKVKSR